MNLGITWLLALTFLTLGGALDLPLIKQSSVIVGGAGFCLAAWALTFHRTFNARQILVSLAQRVVIVLVLAGGVVFVVRALDGGRVTTESLVVTVAGVSFFIFWLERKSRFWLRLGGERELAHLRRAVVAIARTESNQEALVSAFESLLRAHYEVASAELLLDHGVRFAGHSVEAPKESLPLQRISDSGWTTPESLQRQRSTPESEELRRFLSAHSLAAMVWAPSGSPTPSLVVVLGEKINGWPLTYPEVERLMAIAELMDSVLLHARLAAEAALKVRMEQMAVLSRGLAHDLKNLITPVSSFLIHSEPRVVPNTTEAEVHAAAWRSVTAMNDYVGEALFFATRLTPKLESTPVDDVVQSVIEITKPRAMRKEVTVTQCNRAGVRAILDRVLIQRLVANLINNAVDASPAGATVTVAVAPTAGRVRVEVTDTGSGIAPEVRARIFEPYFTTKKLGDEDRGFGLGLTICEKIARLHGGTITVASEVGRGTTMTVDLPSDATLAVATPVVPAATFADPCCAPVSALPA